MIGYVTVGADDIQLAERFYAAFLPSLGYVLTVSPEGLSCSIPSTVDDRLAPGAIVESGVQAILMQRLDLGLKA